MLSRNRLSELHEFLKAWKERQDCSNIQLNYTRELPKCWEHKEKQNVGKAENPKTDLIQKDTHPDTLLPSSPQLNTKKEY